jgi:hypothetical protein
VIEKFSSRDGSANFIDSYSSQRDNDNAFTTDAEGDVPVWNTSLDLFVTRSFGAFPQVVATPVHGSVALRRRSVPFGSGFLTDRCVEQRACAGGEWWS